MFALFHFYHSFSRSHAGTEHAHYASLICSLMNDNLADQKTLAAVYLP